MEEEVKQRISQCLVTVTVNIAMANISYAQGSHSMAERWLEQTEELIASVRGLIAADRVVLQTRRLLDKVEKGEPN